MPCLLSLCMMLLALCCKYTLLCVCLFISCLSVYHMCSPTVSNVALTIQAMLPVGLLQKKSQEGTQTTMEATLMAQQTPAQREQVCHGLQLHI